VKNLFLGFLYFTQDDAAVFFVIPIQVASESRDPAISQSLDPGYFLRLLMFINSKNSGMAWLELIFFSPTFLAII
jgi:hypothetical protein